MDQEERIKSIGLRGINREELIRRKVTEGEQIKRTVVYQKPKVSAEKESFQLSGFRFWPPKLKAEYG